MGNVPRKAMSNAERVGAGRKLRFECDRCGRNEETVMCSYCRMMLCHTHCLAKHENQECDKRLSARRAMTEKRSEGRGSEPMDKLRGFEAWWMEWSTNLSTDVLDEFTLAQQAMLVGILKIAWEAALASLPAAAGRTHLSAEPIAASASEGRGAVESLLRPPQKATMPPVTPVELKFSCRICGRYMDKPCVHWKAWIAEPQPTQPIESVTRPTPATPPLLVDELKAKLLDAAEVLNGGQYKTVITHVIMPMVLGTVLRAAQPVSQDTVLREAAEALLCKLDQVAKDTAGIFVMAHVHGNDYKGANWAKEYATVRAALSLNTSFGPNNLKTWRQHTDEQQD